MKYVVGFILFIALSIFMGCYFTNEAYEKSVVVRMGKVIGVEGSGFQYKSPFIDSVYRVDTRLKQTTLPDLSDFKTKDGQPINLAITVNHRINNTDDAAILKLYSEFGHDFDYEDKILRQMMLDRIKTVIGSYTADEVVEKRDEIRELSKNLVRESAKDFGVEIYDLQINDLQFSASYASRIEQVGQERASVAMAEQQRLKMKKQAEIVKINADAAAQKTIAEAQGKSQSILLNAKAESEAIRILGQAKAEVLRMQAQALHDSPGLIELTRAEALKNWNGQMPKIILGDKSLPLLNFNAESLMQERK